MPYPANSVANFGLTSIGLGFDNRLIAIAPPKKMPNTKNKFHTSFFQSYLKNGMLAGIHEAQMCRNDELMPNDLLPIIKSAGTVKPINGPATYQGQGCFINSIIFSFYLFSLINFSNSFAGTTPDCRQIGFPFLNKISVGTPRT